MNVLFFGIDEKINAAARADSIMLVSIDKTSGDVGILSIPRDTRVFIQERQRWDRINAAYAYGGTEMVANAVANLLRVPVDYYVKTDFDGFRQIIDTLDGIEIHVDREMFYVDNAQDLHIHLLPGTQRLDGEKALQYVRFRDGLGDVSLVDPINHTYDGRVERQRKFIAALVKEILSPKSIPKMPKLISQAWKMVDTNIPWETVLDMTLSNSKFTADKVKTGVLPGTGGRVNGASYWIVDEERLPLVVDSIVLGKPEPLAVQVLNGNGRSGIASSAAEVLRKQGYDVVSLGNADHFNYPHTQVVVYDPVIGTKVEKLAEIFGASVIVSEERNNTVDVTVIIGRDYNFENGRAEI